MNRYDNNDDKLFNRLKKADPASTINFILGEEILEQASEATASKKSNKIKIATLTGAALTAVALTTLTLTALPTSEPEILISLGGNNNQAVASNSPAAGTSELAKDMMIWQPYNYTYSPSDTLSKETGVGNAYKFELSGNPESKILEIAQIFGMTDREVINDPYEYDKNNYAVGDYLNYEEPSIMLYWSGLGTWYYSNPNAYDNTLVDERCYLGMPDEPVVSSPDEETTSRDDSNVLGSASGEFIDEDCYPKPPQDLPSREDALSQAAGIISKLNMDIAAEDLEVNLDEWSVSVFGNERVEGQLVSIDFYISWTGSEIAYASGALATPTLIGEVPLISEYDSVARVSDWIWWGAYPNRNYGLVEPVASVQVRETNEAGVGETSPAPAPDISEPGVGVDAINPDILPPDYEEPEPIDINVVFDKAEKQLLLVWDNDGNVLLLPGYILSTDTKEYYGGTAAVIAVDESIIELNR